eukprot:4994248-Alexandrium_andersonii.AAC.1
MPRVLGHSRPTAAIRIVILRILVERGSGELPRRRAHSAERQGAKAAKELWERVRNDPVAKNYEYEGTAGTDSVQVWVGMSKERFKDKKKGLA